MMAIFKREFKSYFNNMLGFIFCAFILLFAGIYTMAINLKSSSASFEYVLGNMGFIFLIAVPILTMRVIAEEKRQKTDQLLYSLPISMTEVVFGKYLAMLAVLLIPITIMGIYPLILSIFGNVSLFASYGSLLAFFLLGASLIAMGLFISSLTDNQVVAVIGCFIVVLLNYYMGTLADLVSYSENATFIALVAIIAIAAFLIFLITKNSLLSVIIAAIFEIVIIAVKWVNPDSLYGVFPAIMSKISVFERFYNFPNGIFDITSLVYFIVIIAVFLFLTVQSMEKRRWS